MDAYNPADAVVDAYITHQDADADAAVDAVDAVDGISHQDAVVIEGAAGAAAVDPAGTGLYRGAGGAKPCAIRGYRGALLKTPPNQRLSRGAPHEALFYKGLGRDVGEKCPKIKGLAAAGG